MVRIWAAMALAVAGLTAGCAKVDSSAAEARRDATRSGYHEFGNRVIEKPEGSDEIWGAGGPGEASKYDRQQLREMTKEGWDTSGGLVKRSIR